MLPHAHLCLTRIEQRSSCRAAWNTREQYLNYESVKNMWDVCNTAGDDDGFALVPKKSKVRLVGRPGKTALFAASSGELASTGLDHFLMQGHAECNILTTSPRATMEIILGYPDGVNMHWGAQRRHKL